MASIAELLQQAHTESAVANAPDRSSLADTLREAHESLSEGIAQAIQAQKAVEATAARAEPQVAQTYQNASNQDRGNYQEVSQGLQGLGAGAEPFRGAIAKEEGGAQSRLAQSLVDAANGLHEDKVQAAQSRQYDTAGLQAQFGKTQNGVAQKLSELGEHEGLDTQANLGKLKNEATKEAKEERKSDRSEKLTREEDAANRAATHEEEGANRENERKDVEIEHGTGAPKLTTSEQDETLQKLSAAASWTKRMEAIGIPHEEIKQILVRGAAKGELGKGSPSIPSYGATIMQGGVHLSIYGHLSAQDVKALEAMGVTVPGELKPPKETAKPSAEVLPNVPQKLVSSALNPSL